MTQKLDKNNDIERCPNCEMPLEDSEVCNYCDWNSMDGKTIEHRKEEVKND